MEAAAAEEQEPQPQPQPSQPQPQPQPQAVPQAVAQAESDASSSREMPSNPGGGALLSELRARRRSQQHGSPVAAERRLQEQIREQKQRDKRDAEARHARQRADATGGAKAERWAHAAADSGSSVEYAAVGMSARRMSGEAALQAGVGRLVAEEEEEFEPFVVKQTEMQKLMARLREQAERREREGAPQLADGDAPPMRNVAVPGGGGAFAPSSSSSSSGSLPGTARSWFCTRSSDP